MLFRSTSDGLYEDDKGRILIFSCATYRNIYRMMNANRMTLRTSLTDWTSPMNYKPGWASAYPTQLALAWDESYGATISGADYSMLWWTPSGWGYYGWSGNPFFSPTKYYQKSAEYWILPPGVPDF